MNQGSLPPFPRDKPRWRLKQRSLPVADKIAALGALIQQTRQLQRLQQSCTPSLTSLSSSLPKKS
jgi:hypothetical protein